ncbi:hypothetical protein C7999DRAFT_11564 [Corynascus novoguineensis]|uniref:BZIP domain-containing protein n=1 Tax=Corynascus novoguineensis TaxID=1126955 RepID=A0AAN7HHY5_9PEZI|nr:hypothetical protein C7999DRAFT_11564 [Corynascus novoguineensis]
MSSYQPFEDQGYIEVRHPYDSHDEEWDDAGSRTRHQLTPRQSKQSLPSSHSEKSRSSKKKGSKSTAAVQSGSDTEKEPHKMSSGSSRHSSSSTSRKDRTSSTKTKKTDDWTEVTEPDERRRIQNRIAQRKFREKAREQKDRAARDAQNQQYAGSAYHIPDPEDFSFDDGGDLSGLPWGGLNMRHVVARGHASASAGGHSRHSGHTGGSSVILTTSGTPGPVDQTIYHMNPYGYAPPQPPHPHHGHGGMVDANGEVYHGYDSPYAPTYYDFDATAADLGHGM